MWQDDAPTDDFDLLRQMGRYAPRDLCGLVLVPSGQLMCLAWEVNHDYVGVHQFAVADDQPNRLATPVPSTPLRSKLFAVDRAKGDYYAQGDYSLPNPAIDQGTNPALAARSRKNGSRNESG